MGKSGILQKNFLITKNLSIIILSYFRTSKFFSSQIHSAGLIADLEKKYFPKKKKIRYNS